LNGIGVIEEGTSLSAGGIMVTGVVALFISLGIGIGIDNYRLNKLQAGFPSDFS
jgi:hypothetical protein